MFPTIKLHLYRLRHTYPYFAFQNDIEQITLIIEIEDSSEGWDKAVLHDLEYIRVRVFIFHYVIHEQEVRKILSHVLNILRTSLQRLETFGNLVKIQRP